MDQAKELLQLHPDHVENAIRELQVDSQIWQETMNGVDSVYLNSYFYAEMAVAKRLLELSQEYMCTNMEGVANEIARMEKKTGVILAEEQRAAAAVCIMGTAGEIGWENMQPGDGNSTYRNRIIDAVCNLTGEELERRANYEVR